MNQVDNTSKYKWVFQRTFISGQSVVIDHSKKDATSDLKH